jgi:(p)ppGpp synthase/HD superfamily hydrolase
MCEDIFLLKAMKVASTAHENQYDKSGKAYIYHPITVASLIGPKYTDAMIVGLLHDVVEDSTTSLDDLRFYGFSQDIICAVDAITKKTNETYEDYLTRVKSNQLAHIVKCADSFHNSMVSRYENPSEDVIYKSETYRKTYQKLKKEIQTFLPDFQLQENDQYQSTTKYLIDLFQNYQKSD